MTIVLAFVVCLGLQCERIEIEAPSIMACLVTGQQSIAAWLAEHPGYVLLDGRMRCVIGREA